MRYTYLKNKAQTFLIFFIAIYQTLEATPIIYANPLWCGRLGNHLIGYVTGKWLAHNYNFKFYYAPFPYSNELKLSNFEEVLPTFNWKKIRISDINWPQSIFKERTLYYTDLPCYLTDELIYKMKADTNFIQNIRQLICPINKNMNLIIPPSGISHSIAVHVRTGTGYDRPCKSKQIFNTSINKRPIPCSKNGYVDEQFPLKFPPEQFYIDEIKKIALDNPCELYYFFLFTDDENPQSLASRFREEINLSNIIIEAREQGAHNLNVLEDLFSFGNFSILIRPQDSTLTQIADLISDFDLVIFPSSYHWELDLEQASCMIIDSVIYRKNK